MVGVVDLLAGLAALGAQRGSREIPRDRPGGILQAHELPSARWPGEARGRADGEMQRNAEDCAESEAAEPDWA